MPGLTGGEAGKSSVVARGGRWSRGRRILAKIVIALVLLEILLRVVRYMGLPGSVLFYARQDLYWKLFPNVGTVEELATIVPGAMGPYGRMHGYVLNSKGLRTPEYLVDRKQGVGRVVLIGDSFMCLPGGPNDKTNIANVLGRELGGQVINLGLPSAGMKFYQRMLEVEALRLKPDCAVIFFFVGNDLTEEGDAGTGESVRDFLTSYSYTYRLARNMVRLSLSDIRLTDDRMRRFRLGDPKKGGYFSGCPDCWPWYATMKKGRFERVQAERAVVFVEPWPDWLAEQWLSLSKTLKQVRQTASEAGIPILLVLIPDETQVEGGVQDMVRNDLGGLRLDFGAPQRRLLALCSESGIPVLDLLPSFKAGYSAGKRVYLPQDTHWSPEGQELAGRLVAKKIKEILLTR